MGIDIFLSSASRSGYSQDFVDVFAKPNGATHKYRYASKWVTDEVRRRIDQGVYKSTRPAVLCFIDQSTQNIRPRIMPIRFAKIVSVRGHGTTKSIIFRLGDFCKFSDIGSLNETIRAAHQDLPDYTDGKIVGKYWVYDESHLADIVEPTQHISEWESLIEQYFQLPNPNGECPFYRFQEIYDLQSGRHLTPQSDKNEIFYELKGGQDYDIRLYQFHPKRDFPGVALQVVSDRDILVPLNGDTRVFHTRYDEKDYRFKAKRTMIGADTFLSFRRVECPSGKLIWEDFILRIRIKPSAWHALGYMFASGLAFAAPFAVSAASDWNKEWPTVIAAGFGGLLIGLVTLYKDKIK